MAFNPDEYIAKKQKSFDPDEYIAKKTMGQPKEESSISLEGLGRGALQALPIAGSLAGGAIGTALGPWGTVGGAGLGAMAGKSLQQVGEKYFYNEGPKTTEDQLKEIGTEGLYGLAGEIGGQAIAKITPKIIPAIKSVLPKIGSELTGISEQEIKTYAKNADKIKALSKSSDNSTMEAADQIRKKYTQDINLVKNNLNDSIGMYLENSGKTIKAQPVIDSLEKAKLKIDPIDYPDQIAQIDSFISKIQKKSVNGEIPIINANNSKRFLQDMASSAYDPNAIYKVGSEAANAAKSGAAKIRELIDIAEPGITEMNKKHSELHNILNNMNSNLIKEGKPEAALMSAGTGGNSRNVEALNKLGEFSGTPMLEEAQNLAAMRTFGDPKLLPVDTTGKSLTRMRVGTSAGGALGGFMLGGPAGAAIGAAAGGVMTSPLALRTAIDTGNLIGKGLSKLPEIPMKQQLYQSLIQKTLENQNEQNKPAIDKDTIMQKAKGSKYEGVLNNSLKAGGNSFAAANYVLKNRDENYRKLFEENK